MDGFGGERRTGGEVEDGICAGACRRVDRALAHLSEEARSGLWGPALSPGYQGQNTGSADTTVASEPEAEVTHVDAVFEAEDALSWCVHVPSVVVDGQFTPLRFVREFVMPNRPVILKGVANAWPVLAAHQELPASYLLSTMFDTGVSVNFTPSGRADTVLSSPQTPLSPGSVSSPGGQSRLHSNSMDEHTASMVQACMMDAGEPIFAAPYEVQMPFNSFCALLHDSHFPLPRQPGSALPSQNPLPKGAVPYLSKQNDSLRAEFAPLKDHFPPFPLAEEAFGCKAEAQNLWMGDHRSVTSAHKDHYENMYTVLQGSKVFFLLPPCDIAFLNEVKCLPMQWEVQHTTQDCATEADADGTDNGYPRWHLRKQPGSTDTFRVPWIADTLCTRHFLTTALAARRPVIVARLFPGDTLYLPSLWVHEVHQQGHTIAVNHWYDMSFDCKYLYYQAIRVIKGLDDVPPESETEEELEE